MSVGDLAAEILTKTQEIVRSTPTVLIGSGFSCGYGLPHMGALGDHLVATLGPRLISAEAKTLWAGALVAIRADLESGLNAIPSGAPGRSEIIQLLRELISKLIISAYIDAETAVLNTPKFNLHALSRFLRRLYEGAPQNSPCISVITTNYDTLVELFCDLAHLPIDTGFEGFRWRKLREGALFQNQFTRSVSTDRKRGSSYEHRHRATVRIMKPHGSIAWMSTDNGPVETLRETPSSLRTIIVPSPSKYEDALVNTLFDRVRSEMNSTLDQTNSLFCIGFGFNDEHLQGIIRSRLEAGMPAVILTRDLTPAAQRLVDKHSHVVAIYRDGSGSVCQWDGKRWDSPEPLWQLDNFLQHFVE